MPRLIRASRYLSHSATGIATPKTVTRNPESEHRSQSDPGQGGDARFFYRPALVLEARTVAGASARPAAKALSLTPFGGCGYDEVRLFGVFLITDVRKILARFSHQGSDGRHDCRPLLETRTAKSGGHYRWVHIVPCEFMKKIVHRHYWVGAAACPYSFVVRNPG